MTSAEIEPFLFIGSLICAVMAVVSGLRYKSRGLSAYVMAAGFLVLGTTMLLMRAGAGIGVLIAGCVLLFALMVVDFAVRASREENKDSRR